MAPARFTNDSIASDSRPTEPVTCQASVLSTMVTSATATEAHSRWRGLSQRRGAAGGGGMGGGLLRGGARGLKITPVVRGRKGRRKTGWAGAQATRGESAEAAEPGASALSGFTLAPSAFFSPLSNLLSIKPAFPL